MNQPLPAAPSSPELPTWGVVSTVNEPKVVLERFIHHYQKSGAQQITLFFEDATCPDIDWAKEQRNVVCHACSADFREQLGVPIHHHVDLQRANLDFFLRDGCATDWLIHLDADELLQCNENVATYLSGIDDDIMSVQVLPVEAVWDARQTRTPFTHRYARKLIPNHMSWKKFLLDSVYGEYAPCLMRGRLAGHMQGKSIFRTRDLASLAFDIHYVCPHHLRRPNDMALVADFRLIHFDVWSFEQFVSKFKKRIDSLVGIRRKSVRGRFLMILFRCLNRTTPKASNVYMRAFLH